MCNYFLLTIDKEKINPIVIKANSYLIEKYSENLKDLNNQQRKKFLRKKWQDEFNIKIEQDEIGEWNKFNFLSKSAEFIFYLKFD